MTGLLAVAVVLLGAGGVGAALRLRFVDALPTTVLSVTFTLYLAYLVGALHVAWWLVVALCLVGGVYAGARRLRGGQARRMVLPSAQVVAFLVAVTMVVYFTRGRYVAGHDELRLWGAYPKLLFIDGGMQVGPTSLLMGEMQTYTPGLPLFGYFVAAFNPEFADQRVFLAYGLFAIALLAPLTSRLSWARPVYIVPAGVGMALVPLAYANYASEAGADFYASLFVDPIVGMLLGYLLWLVFITDPERRSWLLQVGVGIGVLYLVKSSTLAFAVILLVAAIARWSRRPQRSWQRRAADIAVLIGPLAVAVGTWRLVQARWGPGSKFDADSLSPHLDTTILKQFVYLILGRPELGPVLGMFDRFTTFAFLDGALLTAIGCLAIVHRGFRRRRIVYALGALVVCQIVFLVGIYLLVIGPFGGQFQSFPRYTETLLTATSVLLVLVLGCWGLPLRDRVSNPGKVASVLLSACLVFLVLCFPLRKPISFVGGWEAQAFADAHKLEKALDDADLTDEHPDVVLIYRDDWLSHVGHHHGVYYQLLDRGARVELLLPATLTPPDSSTYRDDVRDARAYFRRYLAENEVRFILVAENNPELYRQFRGWFDRPPTLDSVYRVKLDGDDVRFTRVS